jgi:hypothetical protein
MAHGHAAPDRLLGDPRALLAAAALSCVVALYNGFPLTYPDTGNYLDNAIDLLHRDRPWFFFRPPTYGAFLVPFANSLTLWLLPAAQGLLVAGVVDTTLRSAAIRLPGRALVGIFALLCAASSLPWFSGQIMPDVFTPIVILMSFVVVWAPVTRTLWPALLLLAVAIATHLSHFPLAAALAVSGLGLRLALEPSVRGRRPVIRLAFRAVGPLAIALVLVVAPNYLVHGRLVLSRSSSIFALAHLVGEGAAQRYLEQACVVRPYRLCAERGALPPDLDWFLWSASGPLARSEPDMARGDSTFFREAPLIVAGTLRQEWPALLGTSIRGGGRQLVTFGLHPAEHRYSASVARSMPRLGPAIADAYRESRQTNEALPVVAASRVQYVVVVAATLALLWCLPRLRGPRYRSFQLLVATTAIGMLTNAFVVASLATVHQRYQARVVWLVVLLGAVAVHECVTDRRTEAATSDPGRA